MQTTLIEQGNLLLGNSEQQFSDPDDLIFFIRELRQRAMQYRIEQGVFGSTADATIMSCNLWLMLASHGEDSYHRIYDIE